MKSLFIGIFILALTIAWLIGGLSWLDTQTEITTQTKQMTLVGLFAAERNFDNLTVITNIEQIDGDCTNLLVTTETTKSQFAPAFGIASLGVIVGFVSVGFISSGIHNLVRQHTQKELRK